MEHGSFVTPDNGQEFLNLIEQSIEQDKILLPLGEKINYEQDTDD
jgi:hypothetical protein